MSLTAYERETTINTSDGDDLMRIWTVQRPVITRIRRDSRYTVVDFGNEGGTEWLSATIPSSSFNPLTGAKKRSHMTDEQKQAAAERLAKARAQKSEA